jgi:sugar lactone lactonase YvrE
MVFGRKAEASDEAAHPLSQPTPPLPPIDGMFRQVTDVTWDPAGNTYISDGYINSRVAKYDKDGNWITSFGSPGSLPGQFNTPHAIASDKDGNLYVADRGNRRIQVLDGNGKPLRMITIDLPASKDAQPAIGNKVAGPTNQYLAGAPWAVCITPAKGTGPQYLYAADAFPGRIYKFSLDGTLLGWLGGSGKSLKKYGWIHQLTCVDEHTLFAAEVLNWRVQKLHLH